MHEQIMVRHQSGGEEGREVHHEESRRAEAASVPVRVLRRMALDEADQGTGESVRCAKRPNTRFWRLAMKQRADELYDEAIEAMRDKEAAQDIGDDTMAGVHEARQFRLTDFAERYAARSRRVR